MDAKDTWHVVKFLIEATGLKRRDARKLLEELPEKHYSQLFIGARAWDRDQSGKAASMLQEILGTSAIPTLTEGTRRAQKPSTEQDNDEDEPRPRKRKK